MCVCVCVFLEILVLKIFKLRDYFERFLCWLDHWLSCMLDCIHIYAFHISKNCFEKLAWYLLDTSSIPFYLSSFLSIFLKRNLDTSSIPGGSIEKDHASLIAPRHLLDWSSFCSESDSLLLDSFLDTSAIEDQILDTYLDRYLDTSRYLHLSRFTSCLYKASVRSEFHFSSISLLILLCFSPKTISSFSKLVPQGFFKLFQVSPYLVSS